MPSRVMTRACPCDSPALRNRNIRKKLYTKKLRTPDSRARFCCAFSLVVPLALIAGMVRLDGDNNLTALLEAMDHGRDGYPRWIVVDAPRQRLTARATESIVAAATERGFVALPVDAYHQERIVDARQFDERTLLLVDT